MLLSASSPVTGELPPYALIGHPDTPEGRSYSLWGSLVFAETIKDLSFHVKEREREGGRLKKKKKKSSDLSLSCFPEVIFRNSITHLASRQWQSRKTLKAWGQHS